MHFSTSGHPLISQSNANALFQHFNKTALKQILEGDLMMPVSAKEELYELY